MTDSSVDALWKHVLDHWDDEAAHRVFLQHCSARNVLVDAAVRYRGMKGDHTRGVTAEKKLVAIAALALARLEVARSPERAKRGNAFSYLLIAFFVAATAGLLAYLDGQR